MAKRYQVATEERLLKTVYSKSHEEVLSTPPLDLAEELINTGDLIETPTEDQFNITKNRLILLLLIKHIRYQDKRLTAKIVEVNLIILVIVLVVVLIGVVVSL